MFIGGGYLKPNKGLGTRQGNFGLVEEGIKDCKVVRQRLKVAGFTIIDRQCQFSRESLLGSECVVCRAGRELDIKSSRAVIEGKCSEAPRHGDGPEERVNFRFEHPADKVSRIAGSLNGFVEMICSICALSVQFGHHLRESPV
jgi:hypothetical protein